MHSMTGKTVSRYHIVGPLRDEEYPSNYRAEDIESGQPVALKFLPPKWPISAHKAIPVRDPHICTTYATGTYEEWSFVATELLDGETVADRLRREPMSLDVALGIAIQTSQGLAVAHDHRLIHSNIKPTNIFITHDGTAKILGLGRSSGLIQYYFAMEAHYQNFLEVCATLAPEQLRVADASIWELNDRIRREKPDRRTDLFSLGTVLFEMATGRHPFHAATFEAIIDSMTHWQSTSVNPALRGVFNKAFAKDLADRYQTALEMAADLKKVLSQVQMADH